MEDCANVRIGNELLSFVKADEQIRPLRDQIVIEPLPLDLNTSLDVVYSGRPVRGRVLAVGSGHYPRKYFDSQGNFTERRGDRKTSKLSCHFQRTEVKVGDIVDIGGLELNGLLFPKIRWGDLDVVICREADIALVDEQATACELANSFTIIALLGLDGKPLPEERYYDSTHDHS